MARVDDYICDVCGKSVTECMVNGQNVPLLVYVVVGVPPNAPVDQVDLALPMPDSVRAIATQPIARKEYCVNCFAAAFGQSMTTPPLSE